MSSSAPAANNSSSSARYILFFCGISRLSFHSLPLEVVLGRELSIHGYNIYGSQETSNLGLTSGSPSFFVSSSRERKKALRLMFQWPMAAWCPSLLLPPSWRVEISCGVFTLLCSSATSYWKEPSPKRKRSWVAARSSTMRPRARW